jgi:tetratricopeptide (TPR) repeat protein
MKLKAPYLLLLLLFLALGVYYPTLFAPYNSLDDQVMVHRLLNQTEFSLRSHFAPGGTYDYYRPLMTLTHELDKYVGGLQESFMHLLNVLLHALNYLLVFLFCLHPLNTEAVNWISARADVLAGTFVFLSLLCLLEGLERHNLAWGVAGALAVLLGALSKETALFLLPGVFLLLCLRRGGPETPWTGRWWLFAGYGAAAAGYFALRWRAFHTDRGIVYTAKVVSQVVAKTTPVPAAPADPSFPLLDLLRVAVKVSGFYACKLFQPFPLNFAIDRVDNLYLIPGAVVLGALALLVWRRRPIGTLFLVSAALAASALLVVFTRLAWTPLAERYMYVPCGVFAVALVYGCAPWVERLRLERAVPVLLPLLLATGAWASTARNIIWQDNLTLYQDTVRKSPDFAPAKNELAIALYAHGRAEEATELLASLRLPEGQTASLNRAAALAEQEDYQQARQLLLERRKKHDAKEIRVLEMLVRLTSEEAEKTTDDEQRRQYFLNIAGWIEDLMRLSSDPFNWYRLGRVHLALENRVEAQRCFAEAARRLPEGSVYREPAAKLARNLAP